MRGRELKQVRRLLKMDREQFAKLIGYTGTPRNNATRVLRMENEQQEVPLYIAKLVWLIHNWVSRTGYLPPFPNWPGYEYDHAPDAQVVRGNDPHPGAT